MFWSLEINNYCLNNMYVLGFFLMKCLAKLKVKIYFNTLWNYPNSCYNTHRIVCIVAEKIFLILALVFQGFILGILQIVACCFFQSCSMTSLFQSFGGNWFMVIWKKKCNRHLFLPSQRIIRKVILKMAAALSSKTWVDIYHTRC